jgi:hypothetical protein
MLLWLRGEHSTFISHLFLSCGFAPLTLLQRLTVIGIIIILMYSIYQKSGGGLRYKILFWMELVLQNVLFTLISSFGELRAILLCATKHSFWLCDKNSRNCCILLPWLHGLIFIIFCWETYEGQVACITINIKSIKYNINLARSKRINC